MEILVLFGLPGAGKTFVGELLQKNFGYYLHDGDLDLPPNMLEAIQKRAIVTDSMRDVFFVKLIKSVQKLQKHTEKLVISQTFIKEKYREAFLAAFPESTFFLIETQELIREQRLQKRKKFPLDLVYAKKMVRSFEPSTLSYIAITNNSDGEEALKKQLLRVLK
ncbi:MAG: AAA family ATPase [Patescibacteria group bacterium]